MFSIHSILEALSNPQGRFKTLTGISLQGAEVPEPVFNASKSEASFPVDWNQRTYNLICFRGGKPHDPAALERVINYLRDHYCAYWLECHYCREEMFVFDGLGVGHYLDVLLMQQLPGQSLLSCLSQACDRKDTRELTRLLQEFCRMGAWLLREGVMHRKLNPATIWVGADGGLRLLDYTSLQVVPARAKNFQTPVDTIPIANIALGIKLLTCEPSLLRSIPGNNLFRLSVLRSALLPQVEQVAQKTGCTPVLTIVRLLQECNSIPDSREILATALEALSEDFTPLTVALPCVEAYTQGKGAKQQFTSDTGISSDPLISYDWVNPLSEGYYCVSRGDYWGYLDREMNEVIPLRYDWADDFRGTRAVVQLGNYCGVIDATGREVLPLCYEWVEWDDQRGLLKVSLDGKCGLYDRNGEELLPPTYDWMGEIAEVDLILVRRGAYFGYIRSNGELAIALQFKDAFSFRDGMAQVSLNGTTYFQIDAAGQRVMWCDEGV